MQNLFGDLEGKVAVVTGASSGIGRTIALALESCGVYILAVDKEQSVLEVPQDCVYNRWIGKQIDVGDSESVSCLRDHLVKEFNEVDVLVNAAAISQPCAVREMSFQNWQKVMNINLNSVFLCTQAVLPEMIANKQGSIVNFSSMIASYGGEKNAHYAAAKCGVEGYSRSLAREVGPDNIRINVIAPGMIETPMLNLMPENQKTKLEKRIPLQRIGEPQDIVGIAMLLASEAGRYITGQTIHVNGGLYPG